MGPTEEEAEFLSWVEQSALTRPSLLPLKRKGQHSRQRSNSLSGLDTNSYKISSSFTGPPSPVSSATGSSSNPRTNLASSSWPQKGESPYSFSPSTLPFFASPKPEPNSVVAEKGHSHLPPIKRPRRSGPSEPLPPPDLISRLPGQSLQSSSSAPSSPATPTRPKRLSFRLPAVNQDQFIPGSSNTHNKGTLWTAILDAGFPIYLGTPGFDGQSRSPYSMQVCTKTC